MSDAINADVGGPLGGIIGMPIVVVIVVIAVIVVLVIVGRDARAACTSACAVRGGSSLRGSQAARTSILRSSPSARVTLRTVSKLGLPLGSSAL